MNEGHMNLDIPFFAFFSELGGVQNFSLDGAKPAVVYNLRLNFKIVV
jgi:hypothetical protein